MARTKVTGALIAIASVYGTQFTVSGISNANPGVATFSASHGVIVTDIVQLALDNWQGADGRVARVSALATNDATLEGVDTSNTTAYPAGAGTGTGREITTFLNIGQIVEINQSGGEQNYGDYQYLNQDDQNSFPTFRSGAKLDLTVHDDLASTALAAIKAAQAAGALTAFRIAFPSGRKMYGAALWSASRVPNMALNDFLKRTFSLAIQGDVSEYAS